MGLDFSGLIALSGKSPWQEIRQGKANDLAMVQAQEGLTQKALDEQLAAQKQLGEYQQILAEASSRVMPPDFDRLSEHEKELRADFKKKLAEGLQKNNGNLKKWIEGGGVIDMNNYKNGLLEGEAMQTGLQNAHNYGLAFADRKAGLTARPVPTLDANGQPVLMDVNEQFEQYKNGKVKKLNYDGAYQMPSFDTKVFNENIGNPKDRYQIVPVTGKKFKQVAYAEFVRKGMPEQDAWTAAQQLGSQWKDDEITPYTWGYDKRPTPQRETSFGYADKVKLEDAKYVIEQLGKAMTGSDDVYRTASGVIEKVAPSGKKSYEKGDWKRGTVLGGTSLGKFSYQKRDAQGNVAPDVTENIIHDWIFQDGKPKIKTTQSTYMTNIGQKFVNGNPVDRFGYMPVTDDIISGIAAAKGIPYHSLRDGLIEMGAYGKQTPEVQKAVGGGKGFTAEQEKLIKENMTANPTYSREEIIQALGY